MFIHLKLFEHLKNQTNNIRANFTNLRNSGGHKTVCLIYYAVSKER